MKNSRNHCLFRLSILYILFVIYIIGVVFAAILTCLCEVSVSFAQLQMKGFDTFFRCWLYYGVMLLFARFRLGALLISLVVWVRGFSFSSTVFTLMRAGIEPMERMIQFGVSACIQLGALFYLASLCFKASLCRVRGIALHDENIRELKRGLLFAFCASAFSALTVIL